MQQVYVVHYHEIALKGKNRPMFLRVLQENICRATGLSKKEVKIVSGRLILNCPSPLMGEGGVRVALARVFGISSFSPAVLTKPDYAEIQRVLNTVILESMVVPAQWNTFAIMTTRGDKTFPMNSQELNIKLGLEE